MAGREIQELKEQEGVFIGDGLGETVAGAGKVGVIASQFEARQ